MKTIDHDYYRWLVSKIFTPPNKTFDTLFDMLHSQEFVWIVPNDDNRVADALELRDEFMNGKEGSLTLGGATLLEVIVSLSQRAAFIAGSGPEQWAWILIKNLDMSRYHDPLNDADMMSIQDLMERLIWRTYRPDGFGGFFPLKNPEEDQREVEIWYQLNSYVIERNL